MADAQVEAESIANALLRNRLADVALSTARAPGALIRIVGY